MHELKNTGNPKSESHSGGLTLNDIYFVIFRRKWIILLFSVLGVAAAGTLFLREKPVFRSDSKLLVRYVMENKSPVPIGDERQVKSPDSRGDNIINSEIEILTSLDLFAHVAEAVGPAKILRAVGGGDDKFLAAAVISRGIGVEAPRKSNIMRVSFEHPDPEVIAPVLERLIDEYLKRHAEVHRGLGSLDVVLSKQSDELRFQLNQTEEELRKLKSKAGVISIEETKKAYIEEISSLRRELFNTEAELAEARAALDPTNGLSFTNAISVAPTNALEPKVPADILNQYREITARLTALRNREFAIAAQFSDNNLQVKRAREQVAEVDQQRKELEAQHPGVLTAAVSPTPGGASNAPAGVQERARVVSLHAKVSALKAQLENTRLEAAKLDEIETPLKQLQRKRDLEETNFRYVSAGLERSRFDETLGSGRNANISVIQNPTPPRKDDSRRLKMVGGALGGGLALGLAIAFLLELFLDQTVRRPLEVQGRLHLPLFMAIPYVNGKPRGFLGRKSRKGLSANGAGNENDGRVQTTMAWDTNHPLRPMFEGLRDRIAVYFKTATHKPKLVGISTCSHRAGATTVAAGLAAALSETGDGKVLLVDLHQPYGAAHPFFQGKPACQIDDALEQEKRQAGLVHENLYMALARNGADKRLGQLAKQFSNLVPKLKASDYDYVIFDLPRVSAASPTLRLAGMMDLTLLVVEAEKVSREAVKQGYSLVAGTGAEAQVVLNKVRSYVPARLSGEL
jgi:polysaccharide biosynthesis transport protein